MVLNVLSLSGSMFLSTWWRLLGLQALLVLIQAPLVLLMFVMDAGGSLSMIPAVLWALILVAIYMVAPVAASMICVESVRGGRVKAWEALMRTVALLPRAFGTLLLLYLLAGLSSLPGLGLGVLLVGMAQNAGIQMSDSVITAITAPMVFVLPSVVLLRLTLYHVALAEGKGAIESLRVSWRLTSGRFWSLVGVLTLPTVGLLGALAILTALFDPLTLLGKVVLSASIFAAATFAATLHPAAYATFSHSSGVSQELS